MAGPHLHVHRRIPGGCLVGQRRVAEIVPGAERLDDPRARERRAHEAAREFCWVERIAKERMAEDEVTVALVRRSRRAAPRVQPL